MRISYRPMEELSQAEVVSLVLSASTRKQYSFERLAANAQREATLRANLGAQLAAAELSEDPVVYYISDIHLEDKIYAKLAEKFKAQSVSKKDICDQLCELASALLKDDAGEYITFANDSYLLINGDTGRRFLLVAEFYRLLALNIEHMAAEGKNTPRVVITMGNHELGNADFEDFTSINVAAGAYSSICRDLDFYFLQNALLTDDGSVLREAELAAMDDAELTTVLASGRINIFGAMGFENPQRPKNYFTSYGGVVKDAETEHRLAESLNQIYDRLLRVQSDAPLLICTHIPFDEWNGARLSSKCYYFSGHTHQSTQDPARHFYANNQPGHIGRRVKLVPVIIQ